MPSTGKGGDVLIYGLKILALPKKGGGVLTLPRFFCGFDSLKILPKDNKTRENTGRGGGLTMPRFFCGFDIVNKSDQK